MGRTPAIKAECRAFQLAAAQFATAPNETAEPIATMMRLANKADSSGTRRWAANWLYENCNIVIEQTEGAGNAAPAAATGI